VLPNHGKCEAHLFYFLASAGSHRTRRPLPPTVVTKIAQGAQGVTITAADGTAYRAPHAIVSLPLGVLKDPAAVVFDPPLSQRKSAAVKDMVGLAGRSEGQRAVPPALLRAAPLTKMTGFRMFEVVSYVRLVKLGWFPCNHYHAFPLSPA
jgi:hypothetical protein